MASVDSTLHLGEVFLETADGTRISLGQLKAPFNITIEQTKAESLTRAYDRFKVPETIRIGSTVKISDNPKCTDVAGDGWVDPSFAGKKAEVKSGPSSMGDWGVKYNGDFQWIAPEHLTVVS